MMIVCKICGQEIDETQKDTFLTDFNMCQFCAVKYKELMVIKNLHNHDVNT